MTAKLVCFDLDDTLTREIHSVMLPCILNGTLEPLLEIEKRESAGEFHWIEADHHKAKLLRGLPLDTLADGFDALMKPLRNVGETIDTIRQRGMKAILITAGPKQVAAVTREKWGFDASYGCDYEVVDGVFTGRITHHIGDEGKITCLQEYCGQNGIAPEACIAVGDGVTDIPLFEFCAQSIAINATAIARETATFTVDTDDLADILQFIADPAFV